jgi:hypothetical protein
MGKVDEVFVKRSDKMIRYNKLSIRLFILLFMMHNCAQIFAINQKIGFVSYYDVLLIYCVYFIVVYCPRNIGKIFSGYYKKAMLLIPILALTSSFAAWVNYGQNPISGILTQRAWIIIALLYFPFNRLIQKKELTLRQFIEVMRLVVYVECGVLLFQYFLGSNHYFLGVAYTERYGSIRILIEVTYMLVIEIYSTQQIMQKKDVLKNGISIAIIIVYILLVNKGRQEFMVFLSALAAVILLSKSSKIYKAFIVIAGFIVAIRYVISSDVLNEIIDIVINGKQDGTYLVRIYSQKFYLQKMRETPFSFLFGYGMPNSEISASSVATGANKGYLLTDNGIYGFYFSYGIAGLIWYAYTLFLEGKRAFQIYKLSNHQNVLVIIYICRSLALYSTIVSFFYSVHSFGAMVLYVLSELFYYELAKKRC